MSAIKIHLIEIAGHYDMRSRVLERRAERESGCTIAELLLSFHFQMKANYSVWREDRASMRVAGNAGAEVVNWGM